MSKNNRQSTEYQLFIHLFYNSNQIILMRLPGEFMIENWLIDELLLIEVINCQFVSVI